MGTVVTFKKMNPDINHPAQNGAKGYSENKLTPVRLTGVLAPWNETLKASTQGDYKLISYGGSEYLIIADPKWREILRNYCWQDIKVIGLLNAASMTLIPQKVFPRGPSGENLIEVAVEQGRQVFQKVSEAMSDWAAAPPCGMPCHDSVIALSSGLGSTNDNVSGIFTADAFLNGVAELRQIKPCEKILACTK